MDNNNNDFYYQNRTQRIDNKNITIPEILFLISWFIWTVCYVKFVSMEIKISAFPIETESIKSHHNKIVFNEINIFEYKQSINAINHTHTMIMMMMMNETCARLPHVCMKNEIYKWHRARRKKSSHVAAFISPTFPLFRFGKRKNYDMNVACFFLYNACVSVIVFNVHNTHTIAFARKAHLYIIW